MTMTAVRVELTAPTTSFRYPHFLVGRHPTFDMPPPATIYGHVCSACGELLPRDAFRFAYRFTYQAKASDLEHLHMAEIKQSGTYSLRGNKYPNNLQATVTPLERDFLFGVQMTLYVDNPALADAFRQPYYAVGIGRSQDLATYTDVAQVELQPADAGYVDNTLLPYEFRLHAGRGIVVTMPRFANRGTRAAPEFGHYVLLQERVYVHHGKPPVEFESASNWAVAQLPDDVPIWVDPQSEEDRGTHRAVWFHSI